MVPDGEQTGTSKGWRERAQAEKGRGLNPVVGFLEFFAPPKSVAHSECVIYALSVPRPIFTAFTGKTLKALLNYVIKNPWKNPFKISHFSNP